MGLESPDLVRNTITPNRRDQLAQRLLITSDNYVGEYGPTGSGHSQNDPWNNIISNSILRQLRLGKWGGLPENVYANFPRYGGRFARIRSIYCNIKLVSIISSFIDWQNIKKCNNCFLKLINFLKIFYGWTDDLFDRILWNKFNFELTDYQVVDVL